MKKTCRSCGQSAEHYACIATHCKECWKAKVKANRAEKADYYREFDRQRGSDPKRKAQFLAKQRRRRARGDGIMAAHNAVARAIKKGTLIRPDHCAHCLITCYPQGHHDDHGKPLDVIWLCPICHAARHKQIGALRAKKDKAT
jgi:hypothetical protein